MFKIGFAQFSPTRCDVNANAAAVERLLHGVEADLLVLPELANSGYLYASPEALAPFSEPGDGTGPFLSALRRLAGQTGGVIVRVRALPPDRLPPGAPAAHTRQVTEREKAQEIARAIEGTRLVLKKKAGEHDTLYGTVTPSELAEALAAEAIAIATQVAAGPAPAFAATKQLMNQSAGVDRLDDPAERRAAFAAHKRVESLGGTVAPDLTADRRAAEWVLSIAGKVTIRIGDEKREIPAAKDLPTYRKFVDAVKVPVLARGGVIVAAEIAKALDAALDLLLESAQDLRVLALRDAELAAQRFEADLADVNTVEQQASLQFLAVEAAGQCRDRGESLASSAALRCLPLPRSGVSPSAHHHRIGCRFRRH